MLFLALFPTLFPTFPSRPLPCERSFQSVGRESAKPLTPQLGRPLGFSMQTDRLTEVQTCIQALAVVVAPEGGVQRFEAIESVEALATENGVKLWPALAEKQGSGPPRNATHAAMSDER